MRKESPHYRIGLGGWEHETFDRCFYPAAGMAPLEKLGYYANYFDAVEVRATFWDDTLNEEDAAGWCDAVAMNSRFRFVVKLHSSFTHKKNIKPQATRNARGVLHELARRDRLAALLVQFPYSFTNISSHRYHVVKLAELFAGFPVHVEFRHESWNTPGLLPFLSELALRSVTADLPRIKQLMPPVTGVVGGSAYMRLHGRNEKGWLLNGLDTRYDYLYNQREIREITRRLEAMARKSDEVIVICNNTTGGKALANAFQLASVMRQNHPLRIPEPTMISFPQLAEIGVAEALEETLIPGMSYRHVV